MEIRQADSAPKRIADADQRQARGGNTRDPYYDGIRALAIGAVVAVHWLSPYVPFFYGGYVGVDVFFVLSGFIITTILWRRTPRESLAHDYGNFLRGRVKRLYPALVGLLVIGVLIVWLVGKPVSIVEGVQSAVLAVFQTTSVDRGLGLSHVEPFAHTWSLSVEWAFYLLWPILLFFMKRKGVAPARLAAWAAVLGIVLYTISLPASSTWFYYGLTSRSGQILVGCALSLWALSGRFRPKWRTRTVNGIAIASVIVILLWTVFGVQEMDSLYRWLGYPVITVASGLLCVMPVLAPTARARKIIGARPLAFLGVISYSLYLWHLIAIQVLDKDNIALPSAAIALLGVAGTVVLTALSYRFLEKPFTSSRASALAIK